MKGRGVGLVRRAQVTAAPLTLILLAFALRVYALGRQSLWYDEGFSAYLASLPLREALHYRAMDPHPPLHIWLLHVWTLVAGDSETALRFPSAVAGTLAVALTFRLGADLLGRRAGLLAGVLAAVNPFLIYYAQETRPYSLLLAFSTAATVVLLRRLRSTNDTPRAWLPYILLTAAALWTHYFALFVVVGHWALAALFWRWGKRRPWVWAAVQAVTGLLFLPWVVLSLSVLTGYKVVGRGEPPGEMLRQSVMALANGAAHDSRLFAANGGFLGCMIAAGLVAAILLRSKPERWRPALVLLFGAAMPVAGLVALSLTRPTFHPRYLIAAVPFALVLAAAPATLAGARFRLAGWALGGLLTLAVLPSLNRYYHDPAAFREDYRTAAAALNTKASPNDVVIYNAWYTQFILDYYFRGPQSRVAPFRSGPLTEQQVVDALNQAVAGHDRLWLILWQDETIDPSNQLTSVVRRTGTLFSEDWLGALRIFGYTLPKGDGPPFRAEGIPNPQRASFGGQVDLLGYRLDQPQVRAGEHLRVSLYWQPRARLPEDYTAFVHVMKLDPEPKVVAQQDKPAGGSYHPATTWQPGEVVPDEFFFPVPRETTPGEYLLEIGVYRPSDMRRLGAEGEGVTFDPTSVVLSQRITITAP